MERVSRQRRVPLKRTAPLVGVSFSAVVPNLGVWTHWGAARLKNKDNNPKLFYCPDVQMTSGVSFAVEQCLESEKWILTDAFPSYLNIQRRMSFGLVWRGSNESWIWTFLQRFSCYLYTCGCSVMCTCIPLLELVVMACRRRIKWHLTCVHLITECRVLAWKGGVSVTVNDGKQVENDTIIL